MLRSSLAAFASALVLVTACESNSGEASDEGRPTPSSNDGTEPEGDADADAGPSSTTPGDEPASSCKNKCTAKAVQCSATSNAVEACVKGSNGCTDWSAKTPCSSSEVCSGGACVSQCTNQCTVGAKQCGALGAGVTTCEMKPSGCTDWSAPVACDAGKTCSGGQCSASCTNQCTVGAKQCSGTGNGVATCQLMPNGCTDWDTAAPCAGGTTCSGGACVAQCSNQCTAGTKQCAGVSNGVSSCVVKPSGCTDWDTPLACGGGTTCSGGACVTQCTNQCTLGASQCVANGVSTCVVGTGGCTTWNTPAACAGGLTCAGGVCQGGGPLAWRVVASPTQQRLVDLWGASATDVWAVGEQGTILHYDGATWSPSASGSVSRINGIWGASSTNVFAVAQSGDILRWNGTQWTSSKPLATVYWYDVAGANGNDVWAVGTTNNQYPAIAHFDGATWTQVTAWQPTSNYLPSSVAVVGGTTYVVQAGRLLRRDGAGWTFLANVGFAGSNGMSAVSASDIWFAGGYNITHWDGTAASTVTNPFATVDWGGVFARNATNAFAVGNDGRIASWNGTAWSIDSRKPAGFTSDMHGVWASSASDAWAVGEGGLLLHLGN
jgi:hypothetical protein